jgi:acetyl-CoA C-acetyltransferase
MGDMKLVDTMIKDGLWDAFNGYHMGTDRRERRQQMWQITRESRTNSPSPRRTRPRPRRRPASSRTRSSPVTIKGRKGDTVVDQDEYIRHGATLEAMQKLKPAFDKDGTVTAGNASGLNDGAAAVVVMTEERPPAAA